MQREPGDGLGQNPDAGVYSGHLHGGAFRHSFAGGAPAEQETVAAAAGRIGGLISRMEEAA